ncbi:arsenate reductase (thioredoxin) [Companilactobacillus ginsenosidimutans]|uniref:Arsenate reductase n=1 Tax=Companilactobacillus ginsenosidimutans TaxID=1007676 RepID=A0A0H4QH06_9LACO|nr:arsenate reductase (thioredoxin) [Companilactobacillus ginsenosidimutans]AKP67222.1 arsenate reductase [Companilactobacillus ginsenosidimutans]
MKQIYFLCTGNSCRSQIAEGFGHKYLGDEWIVSSAGVEVHGLNPNAVKVMSEIGIDISNQTSKLIDPEFLKNCDLVVTLCGDARDKCPALPSKTKALHWPLPDPAQATGTDEEILGAFRDVRDQIKDLVLTIK